MILLQEAHTGKDTADGGNDLFSKSHEILALRTSKVLGPSHTDSIEFVLSTGSSS